MPHWERMLVIGRPKRAKFAALMTADGAPPRSAGPVHPHEAGNNGIRLHLDPAHHRATNALARVASGK
jgi:hypothetical protein